MWTANGYYGVKGTWIETKVAQEQKFHIRVFWYRSNFYIKYVGDADADTNVIRTYCYRYIMTSRNGKYSPPASRTLMFSLTNNRIKHRLASDLRHYDAHCHIIVMGDFEYMSSGLVSLGLGSPLIQGLKELFIPQTWSARRGNGMTCAEVVHLSVASGRNNNGITYFYL